MRRLKINVDKLVVEPNLYGSNDFSPKYDKVMLFKSCYKEAMLFEAPDDLEGEVSPVDYYGEDRLIKMGEFYDGYAVCACYSYYWSFIPVRIRGIIYSVSTNKPDLGCCCGYLPFRDGGALCITCPPENGKERKWIFARVLNFNHYDFIPTLRYIQDRSDELQRIDAEKFDSSLRCKLLKALLSTDKIIELSRREDMVLHFALARQYKRIFERLN